MSCGMASAGMAIESITGRSIPESELRASSQTAGAGTPYNDRTGASRDNVAATMRANGVPNAQSHSGQTPDDIAAATAGGQPCVIHFNNPGGGGHFMTCDGTRDNPPPRVFIIRDPSPPGAGAHREMTEAQLAQRGFSGNTISTN